MKPRYLTKSRFKIATDCPTKLFYTNKPKEYANLMSDNTFLESLADGGYQVGALAKCLYPDGIEIEGREHNKVIAKTLEHLKKENVEGFIIMSNNARAFELVLSRQAREEGHSMHLSGQN